MRRDFLKAYILAAVSDGVFKDAHTLTAMGAKALEVVSEDLPAVLEEMARVGGCEVTAFLLGKMRDVIGEVSARGIKATWNRLRAELDKQYKRGVAANARRRR